MTKDFEGTRYNKKTVKNGKLITGTVSLKQHLEDLKLANAAYIKDTLTRTIDTEEGPTTFNELSGEGSNARLNANQPILGLTESNEIGKEGSLVAEGSTERAGQTDAGRRLANRSKDYFFRSPGRNRAKVEATREQPSFIKEKKRGNSAGKKFLREQGLSREQDFGRNEEDFTSARLGQVLDAAEKNYFAVKQAKAAKKAPKAPKPSAVKVNNKNAG